VGLLRWRDPAGRIAAQQLGEPTVGAGGSASPGAQPDQGSARLVESSPVTSTLRLMTMQLWIKGTRVLVRADQVVAISLEKQDDPELRLVRLETAGGRFLLGAWEKSEEAWSTIDALVETLTRCDQRNESGVITMEDSGTVTLVEKPG
jgi:hypothetical protein